MWLILGLLSGLFYGLSAAVAKRTLKEVSPILVSFGWTVFSLPYLFIMLFWLDFSSIVSFTFWWATIASSALGAVSFPMLTRALKMGDLSLTVPFLSFTPLFLIFVSLLMVGEFPSNMGIIGILAVVAGAYAIQLEEEKGFLGPIKALSKNKGAQMMIAVAAIYAVIAALNKIAVVNSNPVTYLIIYQGLTALF